MRRVLLPAEGLAWDLGAVELAVLLHLHRILAARRYSRDRRPVVTAEEIARLRLSGPLSGEDLDVGLRGLANKNAAVVAPAGDVVVLTWAPWQGDAEDQQRARARRGVRKKRTSRVIGDVTLNIREGIETLSESDEKVTLNIGAEAPDVTLNIGKSAVLSGGQVGEKFSATSGGGANSVEKEAYSCDHTSENPSPSKASSCKAPAPTPEGDGDTQALRYQPDLFGLDGDQVDKRTGWLLALWEAIGASPFTLLKDAQGLARGLVSTYWGIDMEYQSKRMAQWWRANPRKHRKDVDKFIDNWFARQYERDKNPNGGPHGGTNGHGTPAPQGGGRAGVIWED